MPSGDGERDVISIHALRKESDYPNHLSKGYYMISIHALRKESDHALHDTMHDLAISIHALRKESDGRSSAPATPPCHFNPRSP